jgi:hypothetical protein
MEERILGERKFYVHGIETEAVNGPVFILLFVHHTPDGKDEVLHHKVSPNMRELGKEFGVKSNEVRQDVQVDHESPVNRVILASIEEIGDGEYSQVPIKDSQMTEFYEGFNAAPGMRVDYALQNVAKLM